MRTTLDIDKKLLAQARKALNAGTMKEAVEKALREAVRRRRARKLLDFEGKVDMTWTLGTFLKERRRDVSR
jgi:Arc/MetJ family transcription regulator